MASLCTLGGRRSELHSHRTCIALVVRTYTTVRIAAGKARVVAVIRRAAQGFLHVNDKLVVQHSSLEHFRGGFQGLSRLLGSLAFLVR